MQMCESGIGITPGDVTQLGECQLCKLEVAGSSPVVSSAGRTGEGVLEPSKKKMRKLVFGVAVEPGDP